MKFGFVSFHALILITLHGWLHLKHKDNANCYKYQTLFSNFGRHWTIRMSWGHSSYLMVTEINFDSLEVGLGFRMAIELILVAIQ